MPWLAIASVGTSLLGASSSRKARKAAEADARARREEADRARRMGEEQNEWFKAEYERTAPTRQNAVDLAQRTAQGQYDGMQYAMQQARELDARNKLVYQPLENDIVAEAQNFDTEGRREELAGQAMADTQQAFDNAQGQQMRSMLASGVNPNSGAALALREQGTVQKALGLAGAGNRARVQARAEGYGRKMDALGLGRNLVAQQAGMMQLGNASGNSASANAGAAINYDTSGAQLRQAGFGGMMQAMGVGNQTNALANQNQQTANYWNEQQNQAIGSAVGGMAGLGKKGVESWKSVGRAIGGGI